MIHLEIEGGGRLVRVTKHVCPKDCYDTCSMLAYVDDRGHLVKVAGDPDNEYTQGKLCCKGYAYPHYVYHPKRLTYPMLQWPRFSGNWKRISWEDALERIAKKIIEIKKEYGSYLPIGLLKGPGNYGVLAEATEGVFSSLGPITKASGSLCLSAGWDAQLLDFGGVHSNNPKEMSKAKLLLLWGVNPAATAIHQMPEIQNLRKAGGKVILIDIIPTATSNHVDKFIQVRPGGDGALALGLIRELVLKNRIDHTFLKEKTVGWESFRSWLLQSDSDELASVSGVTGEDLGELVQLIMYCKPLAIWPGSGLQRYANGGQNMRAIHALAAVCGSFESEGSGVFWQSIDFYGLNQKIFKSGMQLIEGNDSRSERLEGKMGDQKPLCSQNRLIGLNALAQNLRGCQDPPVKMMWITSSNYLARGTDVIAMRKQMMEMDMVVTVDHFLTETAQASDIVLPATTCFEGWDVVASYWHNRMGVSQQAILPVGESRSELTIAQSLSRALNVLEPGVCSFPMEGSEENWLSERITPWLKKNLGIENYLDLLKGEHFWSVSDQDEGKTFSTPSGKFQFIAPEAMEQGCPELPILIYPKEPPITYPFRFLVLHRAENLNSQFSNLEWMDSEASSEVWLSPTVAKIKGIENGDIVVLYNELGEVHFRAKIKPRIPEEVLICYTWQDLRGKPVNNLTKVQETDLGQALTGFPGVAYHDTFVNLVRS